MSPWFNRKKVQTATYSVEMHTTFREGVNVVYEEASHTFEFGGERSGKSWNQVDLQIPANLTPSDEHRVLANLGSALKQLGYEYVIFLTGEPQPIPENEQQAAREQLREMGFLAEVAPDKSTVKLSRLPGWQKSAEFKPKEEALSMSRLAYIALGRRTPIIIVAKSAGAAGTLE